MAMDDHDNGLTTVKNSKERSGGHELNAAVKLQKVYRSYRTRRRLADSAVVAEELWWQAIDYARLNHSTVSFFNFHKPETAASRWNRISLNASKVGKGLSKDAKAQKLAFQHWIEAIDPRHRYGHNLNLYYEEWCKRDTSSHFSTGSFAKLLDSTEAYDDFSCYENYLTRFRKRLDIGDGKEVELKDCPRSRLQQECIKYLGPQEGEQYEYIIVKGILVHKQTGNLLCTNNGSDSSKWIFVMSVSKKLYAGECVSAYSGHYRPTNDNLGSFLAFLKENGINVDEVQVLLNTEDNESSGISKSVQEQGKYGRLKDPEPLTQVPRNIEENQSFKSSTYAQSERTGSYKRTSSSNMQRQRTIAPKKEILQRIKSKKEVYSYQLGHQLSMKWSTGAGPRIGCVADYPQKLRVEALEYVDLSPGDSPTPSSFNILADLSPSRKSCNVM